MLLSLLRSGQLDDEEALIAFYDWRTFWAREEQLSPDWDWRLWLLLAGRGFGKTRTLSEWCIEQARTKAHIGPGHIVARVKDDIEKVLIEGPSGILACSPPWFRPEWTKGKLIWPNGAEALTFSAQEPNQLRGPQCAWAACDELAAWEYIEETWSNLEFGLRLGENPQVLAATTPRPLPMLRQMVADHGKDTHVTRGKTRDNQENLSVKAIEAMEKKYAGTRRGRQELDGEILDDVPGALWTRAMISDAYTQAKERSVHRAGAWPLDLFERIVVAVDPSGSDGKRGDAQGIVVAGKLKGVEEFVVLEDATCQERPEGWAKIAFGMYERFKADKIVAEGNFGGEMVASTMRTGHPNVPVKIVSASRGKHIRAEPISSLYEQKKVMHARPFNQMEDEMVLFTPSGYQGDESPNRADALVWALTELGLGARSEPSIREL